MDYRTQYAKWSDADLYRIRDLNRKAGKTGSTAHWELLNEITLREQQRTKVAQPAY